LSAKNILPFEKGGWGDFLKTRQSKSPFSKGGFKDRAFVKIVSFASPLIFPVGILREQIPDPNP
jgi:hypothetical protein